MSYEQRVKERIVKSLPERFRYGCYRGKAYPHICIEKDYNFIDRVAQKWNVLKGNLKPSKIKYHTEGTHMNSSQVMCINFFMKFFESPEKEHVLLATLRRCGLQIANDLSVENAVLGYASDWEERTNFDFFLALSDGTQISFEVKYTENEFGGVKADPKDPDKYVRKWRDVYEELITSCIHSRIQNMTPDEYYGHYQICRNITYARKADDIVVFLTPRENDMLDAERDYIDGFNSPNIRNLYWEDVLMVLEAACSSDADMADYFARFKDKYFPEEH